MTTFHELHRAEEPLVLPNAWDAGSVLAFAAAGFPAIGTTSFGIAASSGVPDGDRSSKAATIALMAQVGRLPVHLTADIEDGFSDTPEEVADYVAELAALGVVGINIEDSRSGHLVDPALVVAKIAAIKQRTPGIFINARIDNFWFAKQATVEAVRQRAHLYAGAGADGIFVPGAFDETTIQDLAAGIKLPLNVLAHTSLTVPELGKLGVRRVSSGSLPYRASVDAAVEAVRLMREGKQAPKATSYWEMQKLLIDFHDGSTA